MRLETCIRKGLRLKADRGRFCSCHFQQPDLFFEAEVPLRDLHRRGVIVERVYDASLRP